MAGGLREIDELAGTGRAVIAGSDEAVVATVQAAIAAGVTVSFYLSRSQSAAVKEWYWTPERVSDAGMVELSDEEYQRIESDLDLDVRPFRFAPVTCGCGRTFGAFDFLQRGVGQHGVDAVRDVFSMENTMLLQVNPRFDLTCPGCEKALAADVIDDLAIITYESPDYGGCTMSDPSSHATTVTP